MASSTSSNLYTPLTVNLDNSINDPLSINNYDYPGMVLTQTPFNGGNFLVWSRNINMALGAKLNIGFIDGTCVKPVVTDVNYQRWISLHKSYGKKSLKDMVKLKRCWNELQNLNGLPTCTCGKIRKCFCGILYKFLEMNSRSKSMQFLMKLSDEYEAIRTFFANLHGDKTTYNGKKEVKSGGPNKTKFKKVCTRCNQEGHLVEQCIERIGYPNWYKGKKGKKGTRMAALVTLDEYMVGDTPFDMGFENGFDM
ncbi:retrovirus-related pol polyprotein from transposon TNT 1-94 [Tanacetum coccineum]